MYKRQGGKTYTFYVFPVITSPCVDEKLRTIYVNPPKFNEYANFQACIENPDFSLCKKWANTQGVTEEQFYKRLDDYKKKEAQKQPNGKEEKKQNAMLSFLKNYYWVVLLFIIIGGGTVIGVVKWKEKYDQDRGKKL